MVAKGRWRAACVVCICLVFGAVSVEAPVASATPASFVAGKLASGAGEAVMGKLLAKAGLDPTANALSEISEQLTQLSNQIKELQGTSDKTLREVLDASFAGRYDQLEISTITKFQEDLVCYLDPRKSLTAREACRTRFKRQAPSANLWNIANKFNDLLLNPKTTIVEAYAKSLLGTRQFYTVEDQKKVTDIWLNPTERGLHDYWTAAQVHGIWRLPTQPELLAMVQNHGATTVRKYLINEAGMGTALAHVAEFGESGELWTSTEVSSCMSLYRAPCHLAMSTNIAYTRIKLTPHDSTEPKYYSIQVADLNAHEKSHYAFLLK